MPIALDIQHFQGVVFERRDKQTMALDVDSEVVDSPLHTWHPNCREELKRRFPGAVCKRNGRAERETDHRLHFAQNFHVYTSLHGSFFNEKAHVSPNRSSRIGSPPACAERRPTSNESPSRTRQIAPTSRELTRALSVARSVKTSATGLTDHEYGPSRMAPRKTSGSCCRVRASAALR